MCPNLHPIPPEKKWRGPIAASVPSAARLGDPFADVAWLVLAIAAALGVFGVLLRAPIP